MSGGGSGERIEWAQLTLWYRTNENSIQSQKIQKDYASLKKPASKGAPVGFGLPADS
jgi:hypothetical protein